MFWPASNTQWQFPSESLTSLLVKDHKIIALLLRFKKRRIYDDSSCSGTAIYQWSEKEEKVESLLTYDRMSNA